MAASVSFEVPHQGDQPFRRVCLFVAVDVIPHEQRFAVGRIRLVVPGGGTGVADAVVVGVDVEPVTPNVECAVVPVDIP